jgi:hypothetical protein
LCAVGDSGGKRLSARDLCRGSARTSDHLVGKGGGGGDDDDDAEGGDRRTPASSSDVPRDDIIGLKDLFPRDGCGKEHDDVNAAATGRPERSQPARAIGLMSFLYVISSSIF